MLFPVLHTNLASCVIVKPLQLEVGGAIMWSALESLGFRNALHKNTFTVTSTNLTGLVLRLKDQCHVSSKVIFQQDL